jgi:enoyl-CoA hydratase
MSAVQRVETEPVAAVGRRRSLTVVHESAVATVRIDRPPVNAVDAALIDEFLTVLPALAGDAAVRCNVIVGTGSVFIAGGDLTELGILTEENHLRMRRWIDVQRVLETAPKPVIAAINGHALGGGAELTLACDLRIMSQGATIGFPEIHLGLFPGAGGSQRLARLLGVHAAKRIMIEGRRFSADEAVSANLADHAVDPADFDATVRRTAAEWAAKPTRTIGLLKRSLSDGYGRPFAEALECEWEAVRDMIRTEDTAEGISAFLDKRQAHFRGR